MLASLSKSLYHYQSIGRWVRGVTKLVNYHWQFTFLANIQHAQLYTEHILLLPYHTVKNYQMPRDDFAHFHCIMSSTSNISQKLEILHDIKVFHTYTSPHLLLYFFSVSLKICSSMDFLSLNLNHILRSTVIRNLRLGLLFIIQLFSGTSIYNSTVLYTFKRDIYLKEIQFSNKLSDNIWVHLNRNNIRWNLCIYSICHIKKCAYMI